MTHHGLQDPGPRAREASTGTTRSPKTDIVRINEIYLSLQGESTWAGLPCIFIRTTACPLRCSYCDTAYAFTEGQPLNRETILQQVERLAAPFSCEMAGPTRLPLVELTGGEPLAQASVLPLMTALCDRQMTVLLETSGALDINLVDRRVHRIMDLKCPSSGESHRNLWENIEALRAGDEVKFVVASVQDYEWAREQIRRYDLPRRCPVLVSWAAPLMSHQHDPSLKPVPSGHDPMTRAELAERIIRDALPVRFQLQMHRFVWPADVRGV